jgi:hypothetical protein
MISPRLARRIAAIHKWLGLVVGAQLAIWTATGLFFVAFHIDDVHGDSLVHPPGLGAPVDMSRVAISSSEALKVVAEDRPFEVALKSLAGRPIYEIRAEIGAFLVSAETGDRLIVDEPLARAIARATWASDAPIRSMQEVAAAPRESSVKGPVWAVHFEGEGDPALYISTVTGKVSSPRTDLWRAYDLFWSLHIMDWGPLRDNFNTPWLYAAALLAVSMVLFGIALLVHRFTRGLANKDKPQ